MEVKVSFMDVVMMVPAAGHAPGIVSAAFAGGKGNGGINARPAQRIMMVAKLKSGSFLSISKFPERKTLHRVPFLGFSACSHFARKTSGTTLNTLGESAASASSLCT